MIMLKMTTKSNQTYANKFDLSFVLRKNMVNVLIILNINKELAENLINPLIGEPTGSNKFCKGGNCKLPADSLCKIGYLPSLKNFWLSLCHKTI